MRTLKDVLRDSSEPALLLAESAPITASQLLDAVNKFARALHDCGVRKGDVISIAEANTVKRLVAHAKVYPNFALRAVCASSQASGCRDTRFAVSLRVPTVSRWGLRSCLTANSTSIAGRICLCFLGRDCGESRGCSPQSQLYNGQQPINY